MSLTRRLLDEARRQTSASTETYWIMRLRQATADLSIMLGICGFVILLDDTINGWKFLGALLNIVGGLAGIGVRALECPFRSRQFGKAALLATTVGMTLMVLNS